MTLNASFDIVQISNRNNQLYQHKIGSGFQNVFDNLFSARRYVRKYGLKRFIGDEIFPLDLKKDNAQYWPNYQLHLIGGGMTYVMTAEWYDYYGYPYPKLLSVFTMAGMHVLNEAVENGDFKGVNVDPIADLLIFDPLGIVLFSIKGVPQFFSRNLNMTDWSFQPMLNPFTGVLFNNGQKFSFKARLSGSEDWRLFYLAGTEGMAGISRRLNKSDDITVSCGLAANKLVDIEMANEVRKLTAELVWIGGIYYDRNGSLLGSMIFGGPRGTLFRFNLYPGVLHIGRFNPGFVLLMQSPNTILAGISVIPLPVGIGNG